MSQRLFAFALLLYVVALLFLASTTPISPHEAKILYTSEEITAQLMRAGGYLIDSIVGLRLPFLLLGLLSIGLFYHLSKSYFETINDARVATLIFMMLPAILTATTLVNIAIIVLPLVLFFLIVYEKGGFYPLPFVMLMLFLIHEASIIFFVALWIYSLIHRDKRLLLFSTLFLLAFILLAKGIDVGGRPSGHFIEIFGLYATLFSPLLFLYFFYVMYRILLREKKHLLWYISFIAFALSLLLSLRQRVDITDFAPYVTLSVILMVESFYQTLRVRLSEFQRHYKRAFWVMMASLGVTLLVIVFHQSIYRSMSDPSSHFAARIYEPYFLAKKLHMQGIDCVDSVQGRRGYQLEYYGIKPCRSTQNSFIE
jgi:hypothetical protein